MNPHKERTMPTHITPRLSLFAFASLLLLLAGHATADARDCRVGEIVRVHGKVEVIRSGSTHTPVAGERVCERDRFVTDRRGVAELKLSDGSELTIGRDTTFVISAWKPRRVRANVATFELVTGAFRALTGEMTKRRHRFEVKTNIATIGVRGTEFWGGLDMSPGALDVIMLKGKGVYVTNDAGTSEITTAGQGVTVIGGGAPKAPVAWSEEKVKKAVSTITPD
jgi:hypothetical protein